MRYLGFGSTLGSIRTFSFTRGGGDSVVVLPNLFLNMTAPVLPVDAINISIDMVVPQPKHPYLPKKEGN